jgi:hypothetical protein
MKIMVYILLALIVLIFLYNRGLLPSNVFFGLLVFIVAIGAYYAWKRFFSIVTRNNMNYESYEWPYVPKETLRTPTISSDPWFTVDLPGTCIGQGCCSNGLNYDSKLNQCVTVLTPANVTKKVTTDTEAKESFINSVSDYVSSLKNIKPDVTLNSENVIPMPSPSFILYNTNN